MKFSFGASGKTQPMAAAAQFKVSTGFTGARSWSNRDLESDRRTVQAVLAAAQSGDLPQAITLAEQALADGLEHPLLLNLLALKLENEGRLTEALARLSRAREIAPGDVGTLNALGLVLQRLDRPHEAVEVLRALLAVEPSFAVAHVNLGLALQATGRLDWAEQSYQRGLAALPDHPLALTGLAAIAGRRGDHAQAADLARRALAANPNLPDAILSLARAELATGQGEQAEGRLRALLGAPNLSEVDGANAWNLLGDILDGRDERNSAFAAYAAGAEILRRTYAERFGGGQSALDAVRDMTAYFQRARPQDWARRPAPTPAVDAPREHVFLIGFPRSGTTLLELVLAGSPDISTLEEQDVLIDGVRRYLARPEDLEALAKADETDLDTFRAHYWRRVREAGSEPTGKVFLDRYPLNTLKLPLISRLFPEAKIIFAARDPRDVVWSCYRRRFQMSAPMYQLLTLPGAAALYDATLAFKTRLDDLLGLDMRTLRHEDLLADFEGEVKAICGFIGLEWSEAMRDVAARAGDRAIATPSTAQLARGLNTEGVGQWRRYADQLAPVLPALAPWVERLGYPAD